MLPGDYNETITITNRKVKIIGTGARHTGDAPDAFKVGDGGDVTVRGVEFDLSRGHMLCRATAGFQRARLELRDVVVREPASKFLQIRDCNAVLTNVDVRGISTLTVVGITRNSVVDIDRSMFRGTAGTSQSGFAMSSIGSTLNGSDRAPIYVRISNSIFEDTNIFSSFGDDPGASMVALRFSTLVLQDQINNGPLAYCDNVGNASIVMENNAMAITNGHDAIIGNGCTLNHNVISNQLTPLSGRNILQNPKFVNQGARDYRLQPESPARDAAVPTNGNDTDHDFANTQRPQGPAKDIGAYELVP